MKTIDLTDKRIVISRTDSIGDVMLTLPICAWIKENFPSTTIIFLGKGYTRSVVESYDLVDEFEDWASYENADKADKIEKFQKLKADVIVHVFPNREIALLARRAKIHVRVGTSHRSFHLLTCTHRPSFTRKRSTKHESQLNHELLRPFGLHEIPSLETISATVSHFHAPKVALPTELENALAKADKTIILHPKSQGSAKEWPVSKYLELTRVLVASGFTVFFTGTASEGEQFRSELPQDKNVIDTTGTLSLEQLIALISKVDYLVACSTGPLHIAGFLGINTIGFFSPKRPIHAERWKALGPHVTILENDPECTTCAKGKDCDCIELISVEQVLEVVGR